MLCTLKRDLKYYLKEVEKVKTKSDSKRMQAQEVLRTELEKNKKLQMNLRREKEEKQREHFLLRQAKKKKKHRGH